MKSIQILGSVIILGLLIAGCGSNGSNSSGNEEHSGTYNNSNKQDDDEVKGRGKFKDVPLTHPLDQAMINKGKTVYDVKCMSCHKLSGEKLVGPGWKGVTDRRAPEWIMNFVTNTDEMIDKDPAAQALLEQCMVRMPNQNLSDVDARNVLEYMRNNDGKN
jgi:cytochrome c